VPIPPGTQQSFSVLYYLRNLPADRMAATRQLNVHHEAKNYPMQVKVEGVERVSGPWGSSRRSGSW
jgi:hypothetical protein